MNKEKKNCHEFKEAEKYDSFTGKRKINQNLQT
jgi:hypothetical protein